MTVFIYLFIYFEIHLNQFDIMRATLNNYAESYVANVYLIILTLIPYRKHTMSRA